MDGSGSRGVYGILKSNGNNASIAQNPTITLTDDVALTHRTIGAQGGRVVLISHSYGGVGITEAGNHPKLARLAYIAAFAPDSGESVASLIKYLVPGAPAPPILPPQDGFLFLDRSKFVASIAADVEPELAAFMADSQVAWRLAPLNGLATKAVLKSK